MKKTTNIIIKLCTKIAILVVLSTLSTIGESKAQTNKLNITLEQEVSTGWHIDKNGELAKTTENLEPCFSGITTDKRCKCGEKAFCNSGEICYQSRHDGLDVSFCKNEDGESHVAGIGMQSINNAPTKSCSISCAPSCYMAENSSCLFCDLFKVAFNASSRMARISMDTLAMPVMTLVALAMGVWLAITILAFVSAPEVRDTKDLVSAILNQSFIVVIVVVLLQTGGLSFFNLALEPIFRTGMTIAEKTVASTDTGKSCENAGGYGIITMSKKDGGGLPESMGNSIICTMTVIQEKVAKIRALGSASICESWVKKAFIIPHLGYFLTGIGLFCGATILMIAMPFLMLDALLQLAIAAALLPAAIGCYAFKITRGYVKKVWETFLNTMFTFLFLSIIVLILTTAFEQIIIDSTVGSLDKILEMGTEANMSLILKDLSWFSVSFLKIIFVLILTWTVMGEIDGFASQFASSISRSKIGSSIATMGASAAKGATKNILGKPAEAIADGGADLSKRTGRGLVHAVRRVMFNRQADKVMQQAKTKGGVSEDGSKFVVTNKDKKGRDIKTVVTVNADGSRSLSYVRQVDENTREIVQKDEYFTIKRTESNLIKQKPAAIKRAWNKITGQANKNKAIANKDDRGNAIYNHVSEVVKINNDAANKLINANGTYNESAMNDILNNSKMPKDKLKTLIANEIIKKRMPNLGQNMRNHEFGEQKIVNNADGSYSVVSKDAYGNETTIRIEFGSNGRMMSEITMFNNKNNRVKRLSSDGIINRKQNFAIDDDGNVIEDSIKSTYGYTEYYEGYNTQARYNKIPTGESMFGKEEVVNARNFIATGKLYKRSKMYEFAN